MRLGTRKSIVWNYFKKNEGGKSTTCSLCKKIIQYHGGTSNLKQHLLRIHPIQMNQSQSLDDTGNENKDNISHLLSIHSIASTSTSTSIQANNSAVSGPSRINDNSHADEVRPVKQPKLCGGSKRKNKLSESEIEHIDKKLLKMVTKDYQPLSIVENQGFLEYSQALQPLYQPPSRKRLSTVILPRCYTEMVSTLKIMLSSIKDIALTTDIWTSDSNIAYITLTAHFIFQDKLHSQVLSTKDICGTHTGENIANVLSLILNEWNITDKIVTIVSDNGANIKNAINDHLQKHHLPCIAHTLNLSVNEALSNNEKLSVILKKCRTLVGHFKHSVGASDKQLKSTQEQTNLPVLKVKLDILTRWNSCYLMLESLQKIKDRLSVCITNLPKSPERLDAEEWIIINDCIQVLKPALDLTNILSGENYPTISLVVPLIRGFQYSLKNINTTTDTGAVLKNNLLDAVTRRFGNLEKNEIVAKAAFLDPRFKNIGFGSEDNAANAQTWVAEELGELIACQQNLANDSEESSFEPQNSDFNLNDIWSHFDQKLLEKKSFSTATSMAALMISQYLEMPPMERKHNPLEFWSKHKGLLPELYQLAMKYLCIPSTSVPSERIFYNTGQITNIRRNSLAPKHLDEIVFLNSQEF